MGRKDPNWRPPLRMPDGPDPFEWSERFPGAKVFKARLTERVIYELPWGGYSEVTLREPKGDPVKGVPEMEILRADLDFWKRLRREQVQPLGDWRTLLSAISAALPATADTSNLDVAIADAVEKLEAADIDDPADQSWVARLSSVEKAALLVATLKVLDEVGVFISDVTGDDVPTEIRSGTQVLFAIVAVLLLVAENRSRTGKNK